jgi:hypothetical protein
MIQVNVSELMQKIGKTGIKPVVLRFADWGDLERHCPFLSDFSV